MVISHVAICSAETHIRSCVRGVLSNSPADALCQHGHLHLGRRMVLGVGGHLINSDDLSTGIDVVINCDH